MDIDRELEKIETEGLTLGWTEERIARHHELPRQLITKTGSRTDIRDESPGCPTVTARTRKHKGIEVNYDTAARDRAIRYDYVFGGLPVSELQAKWGLSERQVYRALGSMREANNRKARWRIDSRRA